MAGVLGVGARELRDRVVALEDVSPRMKALGAVTLRQIAEDERRSCLLSLLSAKLAATAGGDRSMSQMITAIRAAAEPPSIRELASRFGRSSRSLQRIFARDIGIGPKTICRLARVQRALRLARRYPDQPWIRVAMSAGYYDQPHFVPEFSRARGDPAVRISRRAVEPYELVRRGS